MVVPSEQQTNLSMLTTEQFRQSSYVSVPQCDLMTPVHSMSADFLNSQ
ncbi:unnamed protein product, partial [Rotaria sordida]